MEAQVHVFQTSKKKFTIKQAHIIGNFAEVLTNNQAKNKARDEIGKKLETFDDSLTAYNKAKSNTEVAIISINPNKKKSYRGGYN